MARHSTRMPLLPAGEADLQRGIYEAVDTGQLRLVGADDLDRTVTRPGDIAVGSSGLRLAPPRTDEPATDSNAPTATAPGTTAVKPGSTVVPSSPGQQPDQPVEREIAFSLMTSMSDNDTRDAVRRLLLDLSNAADDGQISWAQIQLKAVVSEDVADAIEQDIRAAGAIPSTRNV